MADVEPGDAYEEMRDQSRRRQFGYENRRDVMRAVKCARQTIIANWDDWSEMAGQLAAAEQDAQAWMNSMGIQIDTVLFALLDEIPEIEL